MAKATQKIATEVEETKIQTEETEVQETVEVKDFEKITLDEFKEKVTLRPTISLSETRDIIKLVSDNCIIEDKENGVFYIDYLMRDVVYDIAILNFYTNFGDVIDNAELYQYDYLNSIGVYEYIKTNTNSDITEYYVVQNIENKVDALNSVGSCLHRVLSDVVAKIPDIKDINKTLNSLPKLLNKIDPKVIEAFTKDLKSGNIGKFANEHQENVVQAVKELKSKQTKELKNGIENKK